MTVYMKKVCLFLAGAFLVVNMLLIYLNVHESNSLYVVSEEMIDDAVAFIRSKGVDITESVIPDKIPNNSVYTFSYQNDELAQKIADNLSKQYFSSDASLSFVETPDGFTYSITDKSANSGVLKLYSDSFRFGYNENLFSEIPSVQFSQLPFKNDNTELDNDQIDALETFLTCLSADKKKVCYTVLGVNYSEDQSVVCVSQNVYDDFEISNMYVNAVIENGKYQEVAKYLCEDAHIYDLTTWCCGDEFFSSLTEEQQELLMKTCEEAGVYNNEILDSETSKALQRLEEAGVTVYTVDNPDEWLAASQSFYDEAEEKYGWSDGLVDTVKNIIGQ